MNEPFDTDADARARFWRTLVKVMVMQVASLIALWLLQTHYTA